MGTLVATTGADSADGTYDTLLTRVGESDRGGGRSGGLFHHCEAQSGRRTDLPATGEKGNPRWRIAILQKSALQRQAWRARKVVFFSWTESDTLGKQDRSSASELRPKASSVGKKEYVTFLHWAERWGNPVKKLHGTLGKDDAECVNCRAENEPGLEVENAGSGCRPRKLPLM